MASMTSTPIMMSSAIPTTTFIESSFITNVDAPLWQSIVTLLLMTLMLVAMAREWAPPDMVMMGVLVLFIPLGIVSVREAFEGFSNTGKKCYYVSVSISI